MDITKGKIRFAPVSRIVIHRLARDLFRFSKGLEPQCKISDLKSGSSKTHSPIIPRAVMLDNVYYVFSHWHGLLRTNEQHNKIPIMTFKDLTESEMQREAESFVIQLLSIQFDKATFHGQLFELAERYPTIRSAFSPENRHSTPKSFAYNFGQTDRKSVKRQCELLRKKFNPISGGHDD